MQVNQPTPAPTNKVTTGTLASAIVTIVFFVMTKFDIKIPPEIYFAGGTVVQAALMYYVKDDENIVLNVDQIRLEE